MFFYLFIFLSCNSKITKKSSFKETSGTLFKTIKFGDCDYVQIEYGIGEGRVYFLVHSESCKNPIHNKVL